MVSTFALPVFVRMYVLNPSIWTLQRAVESGWRREILKEGNMKRAQTTNFVTASRIVVYSSVHLRIAVSSRTGVGEFLAHSPSAYRRSTVFRGFISEEHTKRNRFTLECD